MIVVFVVDTSPSMGEALAPNKSKVETTTTTPLTSSVGMTKLDLAKMTVESISKMMDRRIHEHNLKIQEDIINFQHQQQQHNSHNSNQKQQQQQPYNHQLLGLGGYSMQDQFLLLSTSVQTKSSSSASTSTAISCEAGGRLLVGFGEYKNNSNNNNDKHNSGNESSSSSSSSSLLYNQQYHYHHYQQQTNKHEAFEKELKLLKATKLSQQPQNPQQQNPQQSFPQDGGGIHGLNIALSSGLQLLSRYRLHFSSTDNFGMGRLPTNYNLIPSQQNHQQTNMNNATTSLQQSQQQQQQDGSSLIQAGHALQPACLILLTDGECLRRNKSEGGGSSMQLQFNLPLRELYREPFRWDQRMFCIGIGQSTTTTTSANNSSELHPSLRAFCDVTGGCHFSIRSVSNITQLTDRLCHIIAPSLPSKWPLLNPLRLPHQQQQPQQQAGNCDTTGRKFINGGPICCFQQLEPTMNGQLQSIRRAMLFYSPTKNSDTGPTTTATSAQIPKPPIWVIPESYFPSKKIDGLPPRTAQPILNFSRQYQIVGTNTFDPLHIMRQLHRLDQLVGSNRFMVQHGTTTINKHQQQNQQTVVLQRDVYQCEWIKKPNESKAQSRPHSQPGQEYFPVCVRGAGRPSLSTESGDENVLNIGILHIPVDPSIPSTLTLLPPDPHILLPLLLKVAEVENRVLKKAIEKKEKMMDSSSSSSINLNLTSISKGILLDENWRSEFRAYMFRLPPYYMFSLSLCLRPLLPSRAQSLVSIDSVDSVISQCFSRQCLQKIRNGEQHSREAVDRLERREEEYRHESIENGNEDVGYGQFDKRSSINNYLNALRHMPPPWKPGARKRKRMDLLDDYDDDDNREASPTSIVESVLNLPHECLMAFYESRRRWIFGGTGLSCSGLAVEGVHNGGSNVHRCKAKRTLMDEPLLSLTGVGASTLETAPIKSMGEFKGRLLFSRQSIIGYGCNDSTVSAATTAADGSPIWSMNDESLPMSFFDPKTGEFNDSMENRIRAKLSINFGNPFKTKKGDSIIPEAFAPQRPSLRRKPSETVSIQGSPPHDSFAASVEGEGEAVFVRTSPTHKTNFSDTDDEVDSKRSNPPKSRPSRPPPPATTGNNTKPPPPPPSAGNISKPPPPPSSGKNTKPPPPHPPLKQQMRQLKPKQRPPPPSKPKSQQQPPPPPPKPQQRPTSNTSSPSQAEAKQNQKVVGTPTKSNQNQSHKPPPPSNLQSPSEKPKINLPPGWICVWSKSQRRWYFFDQRTNKSVWEWPPPGGAK